MNSNGLTQFIWASWTLIATLAWTLKFMDSFLGPMFFILLPFLSFGLFYKTTTIFAISDQEREMVRQDELNKILKNLSKAEKVLWQMGYLKDETDAMWKKDQWTDNKRATVDVLLSFLDEAVRNRKEQRPIRAMHPEEIRYLVQEKRKQKELTRQDMISLELKRREDEIKMLEELLELSKPETSEKPEKLPEVSSEAKNMHVLETRIKEIDTSMQENAAEDEDEETAIKVMEEDLLAITKQVDELLATSVEEVEDEVYTEAEKQQAKQRAEHLEEILASKEPAPVVQEQPLQEEKPKSLKEVLEEAMRKIKEKEIQ